MGDLLYDLEEVKYGNEEYHRYDSLSISFLSGCLLFGSRASEGYRPDSDADLVLMLPEEVYGNCLNLPLSDLEYDLERTLGAEVDLVNIRAVKTVFQKEIIAHSKRIVWR